jgi:hypothetical protein
MGTYAQMVAYFQLLLSLELSASQPGHFNTGTSWTGSWVDLKGGLDAVD